MCQPQVMGEVGWMKWVGWRQEAQSSCQRVRLSVFRSHGFVLVSEVAAQESAVGLLVPSRGHWDCTAAAGNRAGTKTTGLKSGGFV